MGRHQERHELRRRAKLDKLEEQVKDGSLVIRQADAAGARSVGEGSGDRPRTVVYGRVGAERRGRTTSRTLIESDSAQRRR